LTLSLRPSQFPPDCQLRRAHGNAFERRLTAEQYDRFCGWLGEHSLVEVHRLVQAPPPEGLGISVHYTTLLRCKASAMASAWNTRGWENLDLSQQILEENDGVSLAPLQDSLAFMLHTRAVELASTATDLPVLQNILDALAKVEKLRRISQRPAASSRSEAGHPKNSPPRLTRHQVELTITPGSPAKTIVLESSPPAPCHAPSAPSQLPVG